ncbi:PAS domain S-box protein [Vibrio sinaloensis]|nr:PAS domain S-box protein [Vibrio sinaloensis]
MLGFSFLKIETTHHGFEQDLSFIIKTDLSEVAPLTNAARTELFVQATFLFIIILLITFGFITWNYNHEKNSMASKIARAAMNGVSAMVITDHNNRILQVNEEFTRVSGYELDDVKGKQPSIFRLREAQSRVLYGDVERARTARGLGRRSGQ